MNGYAALLRLQLINRFADLKPKNLRAAMKENKGRAIWRAIGILVLIAYLGGVLFTVEMKVLDILEKMAIPDLMISMVVTMTMASTLIMSFFYIMSSLFLGRDTGFLAALPLKPRTILCAKLTEVWVSETLISAVLMLPACILYGVRTSAGVEFYARLIPVWLFVDVIPIAIVSLMSTVLIRITALWKHREIISTVFGIGFLVVYMFAMGRLGGISADTAEGGDMLQRFMESYSMRIDSMTQLFPPARWATRGMLGEWGSLGIFMLTSLASAGTVIGVVGAVYRKLSLFQTETPTGRTRKKTRTEAFKTGSAFTACCRREIRSILRVPSYATNILPVSFMPLIMVLMMSAIMSSSLQKDGETIYTLFTGMDGALVTAILTAVMSYVSGMNPALSTAVTREGKGHEIMMSLPVPGWTIVKSKFAVGFGLAAGGVLCAGIAIAAMIPGMAGPVLMACGLCLLYTWTTSCLALRRDIRKPKLDWVTEQQAVKQNFGVLISLLQSWGILLTLGAISFFLISAGIGAYAYAGIMATMLILLGILAWCWMKKTAEHYYCQG